MRTVLFLTAWWCAAAAAQDMPFTVELTTPLSTSSNHPGDPVTGKVLEPENFKGDTMQGHVTESKSGNKIHGEASLRFNFDTLQHGGASVPISTSILSLSNSKGRRRR